MPKSIIYSKESDLPKIRYFRKFRQITFFRIIIVLGAVCFIDLSDFKKIRKMDKPLYTFESFKHTTDLVLVWTFGTLFIMAFLAYVVKKKSKLDVNRRNILVMLCFFIGILAAGTAAFRLISMWKLKPVEIYNNRIVTPYGTAPLNNIRDFYIKIERHYKMIDPSAIKDSARYFFLLERNDKTHVLSEGDYQVDSILSKLNDVMGY